MQKKMFVVWLITLACTTIISCGDKKPPVDPPNQPESLAFAPKSVQNKGVPYSLDDASELGANLLRMPRLDYIIRYKFLGGVLKKDLFDPVGTKKGIRLWYCYNPSNPAYPEFFVAVEQLDDYDLTAPYKFRPGSCTISSDVFRYEYKGAALGKAAWKDYFTTHKTNPPVNPVVIGTNEVEMYTRNFMTLINSITPAGQELYCGFPFAYFEFDNIYRTWIKNSDFSALRFYLGYNPAMSEKPNYLRLMLAGAKTDGTTVLAGAVVKGDDGPFFQKSIPPPPDSN